jgi:UDP-2,3-diacylglucosamine hydrolase
MAQAQAPLVTCASHWHTLDFISDLHLSFEEPLNFLAWKNYMQDTSAQAVFILGDWFDVWVGDDIIRGSFEARCAQVVAQTVNRGVSVWVMTGNRDFLIGQTYLTACQAQALHDPSVLCTPDGQRCLLTHGDAGCLSDQAYQVFRSQVRSPDWQKHFLAQARWQRQAQGRAFRAQSHANYLAHTDVHMALDLDPEWVEEALACSQSTVLIHGHTHRPGDHSLPEYRTRRVLGDWHAPQSVPVLRWQRTLDTAKSAWSRISFPTF